MRRVVKEKMQKNDADAYDDLRGLRNKADYDPEDVHLSDLDLNFIQSVEKIKNFFLMEAK